MTTVAARARSRTVVDGPCELGAVYRRASTPTITATEFILGLGRPAKRSTVVKAILAWGRPTRGAVVEVILALERPKKRVIVDKATLALGRTRERATVLEAGAEVVVEPNWLMLLVPGLVSRTPVLVVRLPWLAVLGLLLIEGHIPPIVVVAVIVDEFDTMTRIVVTILIVPVRVAPVRVPWVEAALAGV